LPADGDRLLPEDSGRVKMVLRYYGVFLAVFIPAIPSFSRSTDTSRITSNLPGQSVPLAADCGAEYAEAARTRKALRGPRQRSVPAHPC
jgi:hypothetical protein